MTKAAITTVNFNRKEDTIEWLESLKRLDTKGLETRIFIISNEPIKTAQAEVILKKENRGSAGGYNDGAKAALEWGADFVLMFNNDTLVKSPGLLKSLLETANSDPKIGAVTPKMLFAPGFEFHKDDYSKKNTGRIIWYAGGSFDWANVMSTHHGIDEVDNGKYNQAEETKFVNITCVLVRSEVFKQGILFDEGLFAYFDDNDWSERLSRAGFKRYYDGRVAIFHKVSQTAGVASPVSDYYITRNRLIFTMRYAPLRSKIAVFRQGIGWLFSGRPAQKRGVWDFFLRKRGELKPANLL